MSKVIGIDLGTTNSVVAVLENGRPEVIPNAEGAKTTPSIVLFGSAGEVLVGELAKRQLVMQPERTINSIKRFMGCRVEEAQDRLEGIHYRLAGDEDGMACVLIGNARVRPEDVSSETLRKMKATAEAFLGNSISDAVITVPAYFNDSQRQATKRAAAKAGLNLLRIVNEPTAAALAYGLNRSQHRERVAVFDFGGGTFDISILDIDGDIFEVKSTNGDTFLGGDNINQILANWIADNILTATGIDPRNDIKALQRIIETAEKTKCELSTLTKTSITLPYIVADENGPKHFDATLSREEFNTLIAPIIERLKEPCENALRDAGISASDLTSVILVGGSTRIPAVRDLVRELFGREPDCSVNPDEVVAAGAAVQAAVMTGEMQEILLLDVTPLSLGIELANDLFSAIIPRNSNIPTTVTKKFTTVVDNQSTVRVHVLQGERKIASQNRSLAMLKLTNIPPAPKEIPEIEVSFTLDANGILTVSATDLTSRASEQIQVEYASKVAESNPEELTEDAQTHAEEDRVFLMKIAVRRRLQEMESTVESIRTRKDEALLNEDQSQRAKEAFFKLDVALAQESWDLIEEAERNAKSILFEITSIVSLQETGKKAVLDLTESAPPQRT
jgi:molecular chaperone DnaK